MINEMAVNELEVNGVKYVRSDSVDINDKAELVDGLEYCIIRTYSAGVFAGYVKSQDGKNGVVLKARRLWKWFGATLSELAMDGTPDVSKCKFPQEVNEIRLTDIIEVIPTTKKAKESIDSVDVWKA